MAVIQIDTNRWPILVVTPPPESSNEDLQAFFEQYDRALAKRPERYVVVLDLRRCAGMPAAQRKLLTERMRAGEDRAKVFCAGTVLVFESAVMRALLTAILWVRTPPNPIHVAATVEEACTRANEWLRASRVA